MAAKPEDGMASLFKNLEEKTGKAIGEWVALMRKTGLAKHKDMVTHLKTEHGLTHGYANQIAIKALAKDDAPERGSEDLIELQYAGAKAAVRPIYEAIAQSVRGFGSDVEFAPKQSYVSLRRSKQFGLIQPTTATRVDVGLVLKGVEPAGRLEASGSFNAMFTHRVRVANVKDVNAELIGWLRRAYDGA